MLNSGDGVVAELRQLVSELGADGGLMSPSVYDTAQLVRFAPPLQGAEPALAWLRRRQGRDGGWGARAHGLSRHLSTLAAMLALAACDRAGEHRDAVTLGARFLRRSSSEWRTATVDDLTPGAELILRRLLLDAAETGLDVDHEPYERALAIGERKLAFITSRSWTAGTAPLHSWEAWGTDADIAHQGPAGDVAASPAATARWLAYGVDGGEGVRAREYLERAGRATGTGVPGVVPSAHPIGRMEQIFGLDALTLPGEPALPEVAAALEDQLTDLASAYEARGGAGYTDGFEIDADDTGAAACVLATFGRPPDPQTLRRFERGGCFYTYEFESNPSVTSTAHCVHALALMGEDCGEPLAFLLQRRGADGLWRRDKWHTSWCYVTAQVVAALCAHGVADGLHATAHAIGAQQHRDGGFGAGARSTAIETAYAVLALAAIDRAAGVDSSVRRAWEHAIRYLRAAHSAGRLGRAPALWIEKEPYSVPRIDRAWGLASLATMASPDGAGNSQRVPTAPSGRADVRVRVGEEIGGGSHVE